MSTIGNTLTKFHVTINSEVKKFMNGDLENEVTKAFKDFTKSLPKHLQDEISGKRVELEFMVELKKQKAFKFFIPGQSEELGQALTKFYIVQY